MPERPQTSALTSPVWLRLLYTLGLVLAVALAQSGILDRQGEAQTEQALKRALVAYGLARTLNGVISVAQGTELSLQPAGVGLTLTPGEVLDPVNDLVERFSWVMLAAASSLGVQRVLLELALWPPLGWLLGASASLVLGCLWWRPAAGTPLARLATAGFTVVLLLRFAAPAMAVTGAALHEGFLAARFAEASGQLETEAGHMRALNETAASTPEDGPASLLERARRAVAEAGGQLDLGRRIDAYAEAASRLTERVIDLIVVFLVETLLLPLAFLWLLQALLRRALAGPRA